MRVIYYIYYMHIITCVYHKNEKFALTDKLVYGRVRDIQDATSGNKDT
jgi:hypothetical protein